jgi:hypothetical protein
MPWTPSSIGGGADTLVCFAFEQRIPLGFHSLDLLENQFEPIEFSTNLGFEIGASDGHRQSEAPPTALAGCDATAHTRIRLERRAIL